ncbi:MAG: hypothetical protein V7629_04115 [Motiliproteus sp.]
MLNLLWLIPTLPLLSRVLKLELMLGGWLHLQCRCGSLDLDQLNQLRD